MLFHGLSERYLEDAAWAWATRFPIGLAKSFLEIRSRRG